MKYRSRSLRSHLVQLVLVSLVPAALFSAAVVFLLWKTQDVARIDSQVRAVRALAQTIDAKLDGAIARADALSAIPGPGVSLPHLEHLSRLVLARSPELENVLLIDPEGHQLFNLGARGARLPRVPDRPEHARARALGEVVVTDVFIGRTRGLPVIDLVVPLKDERYRNHLLLVSLQLSYFDQFVKSALGGEGGIASLLDRNFKFIARSLATDEKRGAGPSPSFLAAISAKPEGVERFITTEGMPVHAAWARTRIGWTVNYGAPAERIEAPLRQSMLLLGVSWSFVFLLALALSVRKQQQLTRYLALVADKARNIRMAREMPLPQSQIAELDEALLALRSARAALEEALNRERDARLSAEHASRSKDEFLAMLGHELRNPLAAIANATRILQAPARTAAHEASATAIIARQTEHLTGIVNDLLDVGRALSGKIVLQRVPVDLAMLARHVVATLDVAGRLGRHRVTLSAADAWVDGDRTRLEQILVNLLTNALTYSPPGAAITVRVERVGEDAVMTVADEGHGIAVQDLPRVFELFFQSKQAVDRPYGGLGIGLTLVKRLVELHGGRIEASSAGLGQGAAFTVRLPLVAPPVTEAPTGSKTSGRARRILLVEDNPDTRESLRLALELDGHEVHVVPDAEQGLEVLARYAPDVALVDVGLPGMDGYAFARAVRGRGGSRPFLIALTGYGAESDRQRATAAGFDTHLTKPADFEALLRLVQERPAADAALHAQTVR